MKQTIIRMVNLLLIVGILYGYQQCALAREMIIQAHEQEEKAARTLEKEYQRLLADMERAAAENQNMDSGNEVAESLYKDGIYEGTGEGYGGDVVVKLSMEEGEITSAELVSAEGEDTLYLNLAMELLDRIVEEQRTDLDGISGATYSSRGILSAVTQAMEKAGGDE